MSIWKTEFEFRLSLRNDNDIYSSWLIKHLDHRFCNLTIFILVYSTIHMYVIQNRSLEFSHSNVSKSVSVYKQNVVFVVIKRFEKIATRIFTTDQDQNIYFWDMKKSLSSFLIRGQSCT